MIFTIPVIKCNFIIIVVLFDEVMELVFFFVVVELILEVACEQNEEAEYYSAHTGEYDNSCLCVQAIHRFFRNRRYE